MGPRANPQLFSRSESNNEWVVVRLGNCNNSVNEDNIDPRLVPAIIPEGEWRDKVVRINAKLKQTTINIVWMVLGAMVVTELLPKLSKNEEKDDCPSGEQVCESEQDPLSETNCLTKGCCKWSNEKCFSNVGYEICEECPEVFDIRDYTMVRGHG